MQDEEIRKLIEETILTTDEYITTVSVMLKSIAEDFYNSPKQQSWNQLAELFEGIEWIIDTMLRIDSLKDLDKVFVERMLWNEYVNCVLKLNEELPDLEEAMKNQDNILIGDLLNYELYPIFVEGLEKLKLLSTRKNDHYVS